MILLIGVSPAALASPATTLTGTEEGDEFGSAISGAGDVNADGHADLVVGAVGEESAYVFLGSESGIDPGSAVALLHDALDFGQAVSRAGDVNGDGFGDVLASGVGAVGVYLGSGAGVDAGAWKTIRREGIGGGYGEAVSAGDLDGDGFSDVLVGYTGYDGDGVEYGGCVEIYMGAADGVADAGWLPGLAASGRFGAAVYAGADFDGDGLADVAVGAPEDGENSSGRAYVYLGATAGLTGAFDGMLETGRSWGEFGSAVAAADLDGDGYGDLVVGTPIPGSVAPGAAYIYAGSASGLGSNPTSHLEGEAESGMFGQAASGAGDVDGDGYEELLVGAPGADAAYLYAGSAGGVIDAPLLSWAGEPESDGFGWAVAGLGDADGSGYADLAIGASSYGSGLGRVYVYAGCSGEDADGDGEDCFSDCDDSAADVHAAAPEACDGVDDDCDGLVDDEDPSISGQATWYADEDGDGYGDAGSPLTACGPAGYVSDATDCEDDRDDIYPGAPEPCDAYDNDCDGSISDCGDAADSGASDTGEPPGAGDPPGEGAPGGCGCGGAGAAGPGWLALAALAARRRAGSRPERSPLTRP